jgi:hypothetical protein
MRFQRGAAVEDVLQNSKHTLFVEGKTNQAFDPIVMKELLNNNGLQMTVKPMGFSDNVRSAAQALIYHHPSYYFLIDRDDNDDSTVEKSWNSFPDVSQHNLLIWKKRELENYFIEPTYLSNSSFLKTNLDDLKERILNECTQRIFIDAANFTILHLNKKITKKLRYSFNDFNQFKCKEDGEQKLEEVLTTEIASKKHEIDELLTIDMVKQIYFEFVQELSGGIFPLQYGCGTWLEQLSGKEIMNNIMNQCFQVQDKQGKYLQGEERTKQVVKKLLSLPLNQQPDDFQNLVNLLKIRINS